MISGRAPSELLVSPEHDKILNRMDNGQLELFAPRVRLDAASDAGNVQRLVAENISDEALIAALPDSTLADEAGRRRLIGAVSARTALCHRFVGFGVHDLVPEQSAALGALAEIGGREASRSVARMVGKGGIQGPTLAIAMAAASRRNVVFSPDVAAPATCEPSGSNLRVRLRARRA